MNQAEQMTQQGMAWLQQGRLAEAEAVFRQVVAQNPAFGPGYNNLGLVLEWQQRLGEAAECYRRAAMTMPEDARIYANLGSVLRRLGQMREAVEWLERAARLNGGYLMTFQELSAAYIDLQRWPEAAAALRRVVSLKPDHAPALVQLANLSRRLGRLDEAIGLARRAIEIRPEAAEAYNALGNALHFQHKMEEAAAALRRAVELRPDVFSFYVNLANVMCSLEDYDQAIALYDKALELKPDQADVLTNLANLYGDLGRMDEAVEKYRRALELRPNFADGHSNLLQAVVRHWGHEAERVLEEHVQWAQRHAPQAGSAQGPVVRDLRADRPLRIGYVSGDFRWHSVAYFFEPILAGHDHKQFLVTCYSNGTRQDKVTARLKQLAHGWRDVAGWTEEQLCAAIVRDQIDILVDLSGHTAGNRLLAFAQKPAPIQVAYLGYPATTGLASIDYRLTDAVVDPPGRSEGFYTEKLWRLPGPFLCYQPAPGTPYAPPAALPARPTGAPRLTLGSFNNFAKVTEELVRVWAGILKQLPEAALLLKSNGLGSELARRQVERWFGRHGIGMERIELRGRDPSFLGHLELYGRVDVALDTFPYNGTTTTCEAMWMGVPVVCLAGSTSVSRVGASLMRAVELEELVGQTEEDYARIAVELARDEPRRRELRGNLRERMRSSPLMDAKRFVAELEGAYRQMWREYCGRQEGAEERRHGGKRHEGT